MSSYEEAREYVILASSRAAARVAILEAEVDAARERNDFDAEMRAELKLREAKLAYDAFLCLDADVSAAGINCLQVGMEA